MNEYQRLLAEREALDKKIAEAKAAGVRVAFTAIDKILEDYQVPLEDFRNHYFSETRKSPLAGTKAPLTHQDPKNPNNTWTGRGAFPKWMREAIEQNPNLTSDDFLITK